MHLKEHVRLSHSTKAEITTKLTNRNQEEKCRACLNLKQRAHDMFCITIMAGIPSQLHY